MMMAFASSSIPNLVLPVLGVWEWELLDTWIVILGAVAAMSCTLPGIWLVLRQQSMMGDALSHTALPGVVIAFLTANWAVSMGWMSPATMAGVEPVLLAIGAIVIGVLTALLTEGIQRMGRVEASAALGVVFTTFFALGLLLLRLKADSVHIDPECVLFGQLVMAVWDTVSIGGVEVPRAVLTNLSLLLINGLLMALFRKELTLAAFDPELATSLGINARLVNYCLMAVTATTMVMAFTTVGSILVVAILIVPAACGLLAAERLPAMVAISLIVAAASALVGHILAKTVPGIIAGSLGLTQVQDASTAGMIAVACGGFFLLFYLFSPRHSPIIRHIENLAMACRMAEDDVLGTLYRMDENDADKTITVNEVRHSTAWIGPIIWMVAQWRMRRRAWIITTGDTMQLTPAGKSRAAEVVRGHRLWESYLYKNFNVADTQLHESADRVEHYLNQDLRTQLEAELDSPSVDPHGKAIPPQ